MKWIASSLALLAMTMGTAHAKSISTGTLKAELENNALIFDDLIITFQRTLRIPDDGKQYPLPPGLGRMPVYRVADYADKLPKKWVDEGGVFIPMYQREALWISFDSPESWRPRAVKIGIGKINVITGEPWDAALKKSETQDYLVAPTPQPWIDGIKAGKDFIRQFVAMPLGKGITVEGQITGKEEEGGLQIVVTNPKKGRFKKPVLEKREGRGLGAEMMALSAAGEEGANKEMGLGAGGKMTQKIYPDPYGFDTWDLNKFGTVMVHIVNSDQFEKITGKKPPETPITKKDYELYNHPWFELYDEKLSDIPAPEKLRKVKPIPKAKEDEESIKVKKTIKYKLPQPEKSTELAPKRVESPKDAQ